MKKTVSILIIAAMLMAVCAVFVGCGENGKTDPTQASEASTQASSASTQAATKAETTASVTEAAVQQSTAASEAVQASSEYQGTDIYSGITENQAAAMALSYVGAGYEVVSAEQKYLRNQEAWYIGVRALTDDSTVYYLYV